MVQSVNNKKGGNGDQLTKSKPGMTGKPINSTQRFSPKLTIKLKSLIPTSSKETLQTHSKWILFHSNRHEQSICTTLLQTLLQSCCNSENNLEHQHKQHEKDKGLVYLTIIHEMLNMNKSNPGGWNRHSKFRLRLGDSVLLPFLEQVVGDSSNKSYEISSPMLDSLETMMEVWKEIKCFDGSGGDILINEISRLASQIKTFPVNESHVKDEEIDSMDVDTPGETVDDSTVISTSSIKNSASTTSSKKVEKISKTTEQQQEVVRKNASSNSEETNTHAPLTPTASDDNLFGLIDEEESIGGKDKAEEEEDLSPNKSSLEINNKLEKIDEIKTATTQEKDFDFECEGIPQRKVEIHQLQAPCKSIATVQITRDLHSDTALSVSSLLSTVPEPILKACRDSMGKPPSQGNDSIPDFEKSAASIDLTTLPSIPDPVLDLNLKQILSKIRSHRDIVQKQKVARETLVNLLVQSRCQFGSKDTAEMFYGLRETVNRLQNCKSKVLDAMELEGLDREGIDYDEKANSGKDGCMLKDFEWFSREQAHDEKSSKRARLS